MKKIIIRLVIVILIVSILSTMLIFGAGCAKKEKKAIILIHGIMGGVLYDADENIPLWTLDSIEDSSMVNSLASILGGLNKLALDENGESPYNIRPANMNDEIGFYSILKLFEPLYNELIPKYGNDYEIIIWQYDWRLSPEDSADKLQAYIDDNNYDKVIFCTHSMGGNVVSEYLTRSEANIDKTELFISVCTPFFGSMQAYHFLYDGLLSNMSSYIANMTKELGMNLPSVYMLSPSYEFQYAPEYSAGDAMLKLNGVALTYAETESFFKEQDFAKKQDGTLKYAYANKTSYQSGHMVEANGKMVHISTKVNTHYIQGTGWNTIKTVDINTVSNKIVISENTDGDCVVSIYSGTAGQDLSSDNVYLIDGPDHITMMAFDETVTTVMEILERYFK